MKIEAGKWYKMRNGEKAYVAAITKGLFDNYQPVIGYYSTEGGGYNPTCWTINGIYMSGLIKNQDLISLWEGPTQVKLPEKLRLFNPELTFGQKGEMKASLCNVEISYDRINQLIDYCESLQTQIDKLKESTVIEREYGE